MVDLALLAEVYKSHDVFIASKIQEAEFTQEYLHVDYVVVGGEVVILECDFIEELPEDTDGVYSVSQLCEIENFNEKLQEIAGVEHA